MPPGNHLPGVGGWVADVESTGEEVVQKKMEEEAEFIGGKKWPT